MKKWVLVDTFPMCIGNFQTDAFVLLRTVGLALGYVEFGFREKFYVKVLCFTILVGK